MRLASDLNDAFSTPLPQDPASSLSKAIYFPTQTFGIKIPDPFEKSKNTFWKKIEEGGEIPRAFISLHGWTSMTQVICSQSI